MIINFDNIGGGSGGGGSYTLPVASQSTLGGVKVGSGLTIDGNGVLSSNGSGSSDYLITEALSAITNPAEGQMATVESSNGTVVWTKIQISDYQSFTENTGGNPEDFLARIHWGDWDSEQQGEEDLLAVNVYQSGVNFYWNFENDGAEHTWQLERDGVYYTIAYKTHNDSDPGNCYFLFRAIGSTPYGNYIIQLRDYVATAETSEAYLVPGGTYVYAHGQWVQMGNIAIYSLPDNGFETSGETIAFVQKIKADYARGVYPHIYHRYLIFNPIDLLHSVISFENFHAYNSDWILYLSDSGGTFGDNGFNEAGYRMDQNAIYSPDMGVITGSVDSGGTANGDMGYAYYNSYSYRFGIRTTAQDNPDEWCSVGWEKFWYKYKIEDQDSESGWKWYFVMGADVPVDTTIYSGVWGWPEGDYEHIETLSWTSGATYESQTYTKYVPQS